MVHHQRLPFPDHHSIERVFATVRPHLPDHVETVLALAPVHSKGVLPRLRSTLAARRRRGDVHHVTGDNTFVGLLLPRRRTVLTIHDCEFLDRAGWLRGLVYRVLWLQLPCLRARVVTVVSPGTADHLRRVIWVKPRDLRIVPDPLPDGFSPTPLPRNDPPVVLQLGTRPNKGFATVVHALAGTGWRLLVVGDLTDEQRALLRQHAVDVDARSRLTEDELARAYADADVLVFASTREGFGMPVLEAQASGRPVVAAARSPIPWVASPGGALLVDPDDHAAIRDALTFLFSDADTTARLVAKGLDNVARFHPEKVAAQYAAIYDELA